jgi:hypothetical protein
VFLYRGLAFRGFASSILVCLFTDSDNSSGYIVSLGRSCGRELSLRVLSYCSRIRLEELRTITKNFRIASVLADVLSGDLRNTS